MFVKIKKLKKKKKKSKADNFKSNLLKNNKDIAKQSGKI